MKNTELTNIIRWSARITGTLLVILVLIFFVISTFFISNKEPTGHETYIIISWVVLGIGFAALIMAWWKEGLGGLISLISLIVFNLLAIFNPIEGSGYGFILLIILVPSILYLLYWLMKRNMLKK